MLLVSLYLPVCWHTIRCLADAISLLMSSLCVEGFKFLCLWLAFDFVTYQLLAYPVLSESQGRFTKTELRLILLLNIVHHLPPLFAQIHNVHSTIYILAQTHASRIAVVSNLCPCYIRFLYPTSKIIASTPAEDFVVW